MVVCMKINLFTCHLKVLQLLCWLMTPFIISLSYSHPHTPLVAMQHWLLDNSNTTAILVRTIQLITSKPQEASFSPLLPEQHIPSRPQLTLQSQLRLTQQLSSSHKGCANREFQAQGQWQQSAHKLGEKTSKQPKKPLLASGQ